MMKKFDDIKSQLVKQIDDFKKWYFFLIGSPRAKGWCKNEFEKLEREEFFEFLKPFSR